MMFFNKKMNMFLSFLYFSTFQSMHMHIAHIQTQKVNSHLFHFTTNTNFIFF